MNKSSEEITKIIKEATDTQKGRGKLGRAMSAFITDNLSKRRLGMIEQIPMKKCPSCSVEYYLVHPDNGCALTDILVVMDT